MNQGFTVIVGDANGADRAVQEYLSGKQSADVIVFCMEDSCRNNIGDWPTRMIEATDPGRKDFHYYSTKDRAMAAEADYALMLWDGESRGTLRNIEDLVERGKPVVVYISPQKSFSTLRSKNDLIRMLSALNGPSAKARELSDRGERSRKLQRSF
ncbi:MAG TPA: hypothetical protein VMF66_01790 [Candidatus Acidoferrum sp.]|nr:hypothetical protein [Candidatus Acidoferrum sp.]